MENYGKILYEYSDAKHALDMTKSERRRYIKSFTAVWIMICVLLLTVWCIVNCVLDVRLYGSSAIKSYVFLFIVLSRLLLVQNMLKLVFGYFLYLLVKISDSQNNRLQSIYFRYKKCYNKCNSFGVKCNEFLRED